MEMRIRSVFVAAEPNTINQNDSRTYRQYTFQNSIGNNITYHFNASHITTININIIIKNIFKLIGMTAKKSLALATATDSTLRIVSCSKFQWNWVHSSIAQ